jgi:methanogenic corrinoid protein MtbC1
MYTIKQASTRTGIAVPTIRAWERRYGIGAAARTASGYRLYDEDALVRLTAMRRLVAEGWQPSLAAAAIAERGPGVAGPEPGTQPGSTPGAGSGNAPRWDPPDLAGGPEAPVDPIVGHFVAAAAALDATGVQAALDDAFSHGSFERAVSDLVFPALRALGKGWADGTVSVAGEHLASHAVLRRFAGALDAAGRGDPGQPPVVVGLPPGSRHELGALAFAVALRRSGVATAYLGPDLPADDWVRAAADASAAVVGVVTSRDRRAARDVLERLRAAAPRVIAVGGERADAVVVPGVVRLPAGLVASVAAMREALGASEALGATGTLDASGSPGESGTLGRG